MLKVEVSSANCPLASPLISLQVHLNTDTITHTNNDAKKDDDDDKYDT